jgi:hypothetical protein
LKDLIKDSLISFNMTAIKIFTSILEKNIIHSFVDRDGFCSIKVDDLHNAILESLEEVEEKLNKAACDGITEMKIRGEI